MSGTRWDEWRYTTIRTTQGPIVRHIPVPRIFMPRIHRALLDSVFYLYETEEDAKNGTKAGGTGFFVSVQSEDFPHRDDDIYAITCKHVVKPSDELKKEGYSPNLFMRVNTIESSEEGKEWDDWRTQVFNLEGRWQSYEDFYPGERHDLAICEIHEIDLGHEVKFIRGPLLTKAEYVGSFVGYGDDVFMIGRYIDHDGKVMNLPSVRFGNVSIIYNASNPLENLEGYDEPSFVVEMRSLSGYSGSPAFLYSVDETRREAYPTTLLGVQWSHQPHEEYVRDLGRYVKVYSGMTNVIPAWHIQRMLDWEDFKMRRQQADDDYAKTHAANRPRQILTSAQRKPQDDESAPTEQEFFDALDKAIRPLDDDNETADQ